MTTDEDGVEVGGGVIPFWNAAPPEDSVRSWERRRERERDSKGGERRGSRGKTWRGKGSLVLIKKKKIARCCCSRPVGVTVRQALKRECDNGRGGRNSERCSYTNRNGIEEEVECGDHKGSDSFDWTAFVIISLPA